MEKRGFTFFEILVATFLLSVVIVGLVSVFVSAKKLTLHNRSRVTAGELGKAFLDPLQMQVRQDTWNTSSLAVNGTSNSTKGTADGLDRNYTATYNFTYGPVIDGTAVANLTRVQTVINWTEADVP